MEDCVYNETNKKFKKYKKCTLPFYFFDDERNVSNWIHFDGDSFIENSQLYEAFSEITFNYFIYHYEIALHYYDLETNSLKTDIEVLRSSNINDVIEAVYTHPESFSIPRKYTSDYAKQEIDFLIRLKNYLLLIGLKDRADSTACIALQRKYRKSLESKRYQKELTKLKEKEDFNRVSNELVNKYRFINYMIASDEIIEAIKNKKKKTRIFRQYDFSPSRIGQQYFILDKNNNYRAIIEITREKVIPFKDLRDNSSDYLLNGFETFEDYKKNIFKEFSNDDITREKFTVDSPICIASFKVVEKF